MELAGLLDQLGADGERLTSLARTVDLAADVPTCPAWTLADLLHHLGGVHRWATGFVRGVGRQPEDGDLERFVGGWPPNGRLADWLSEGHTGLVEALSTAPSDLETWTFMDAPSPLMFWARRQAHETAIHRIDGESAAGEVTDVPASFAVDGIEELLFGFAPRARRPIDVDRAQVMAVEAMDVGRAWRVTLGPDGISVQAEGGAEADASIRGKASALYRFLWNRGGDVGITGDETVTRLWAETAQVTWS